MEDKNQNSRIDRSFCQQFRHEGLGWIAILFHRNVLLGLLRFARNAAETISVKEYVRLRRESLEPLKIQHLVSNYEIKFLE